MSISITGSYLASYGFSSLSRSSVVAGNISRAAGSTQSIDYRGELTRTWRAIEKLQKGIAGMTRMLQGEAGSRGLFASAESSSRLGLATRDSAATLRSTAEINSAPTSFSSFAPPIRGKSTASVAVGGVYAGPDDSLDFRFDSALKTAVVGTDAVTIEVLDQRNNLLETVSLDAGYTPGDERTLSNGLTLSFSDGNLVRNNQFKLDVYGSIPAAVNPDNPFNGTGDNHANLGEGESVSDGAFVLNGITINVYASDSLNSVLDRINGAGAGVTAVFDEAAEKVVLTQKTAGSGAGISLGADTSGFLKAARLDSAIVDRGESRSEAALSLDEVGRFGSVVSGSISVNGVAVAFDTGVDSLNAILARISRSGAGVQARFDEDTGKVKFESERRGAALQLDEGATGLFRALGVRPGEHHPDGDRLMEGLSAGKARKVSAQSKAVADLLNGLFANGRGGSLSNRHAAGFRTGVIGAISDVFDTTTKTAAERLGVSFDIGGDAGRLFDFSVANQRRFEFGLRNDPGELQQLLLGQAGDDDGLLQRIGDVLDDVRSGLKAELGSLGLNLDVVV